MHLQAGRGMCTLPEMRCSDGFVLVGVVHNSPSALTQLVHRAALLYLLGDALPYDMQRINSSDGQQRRNMEQNIGALTTPQAGLKVPQGVSKCTCMWRH